MTIYVLKYNNYYNRILKKLDTVNEYLTGKVLHQDYDLHENVSFNPNDGVTTSQVVNFDASKYDYVLAANNDGIQSRWFIIEAQRNRTGQYTLQLQRDIVADYFDDIKDSPMFIEKATVGLNDSAIFNAEEMTFNEIKSKETLLKDDTNSAWIALYFAQSLSEAITGSVTINAGADIDLSSMSHNSWSYASYTNKIALPEDYGLGVKIAVLPENQDYKIKYVYKSGNTKTVDTSSGGYQTRRAKAAEALLKSLKASTYSFLTIEDLLIDETGYLTGETVNDLLSYNNKTIAFSDGVFECKIEKKSYSVNIESGTALTLCQQQIADQAEVEFNGTGYEWSRPNSWNKVISIVGSTSSYSVTLTKVEGKGTTYSYTIASGHHRTEDVPYDIVLLPFNDITVKIDNTWAGKTTKSNVSLLVAKDIIEKNKGSNKLIDAQIVPYFSEPDKIIENPIHPEIKLNLNDDGVEGATYDLVKDSNNNLGTFFWYAKKASFTNRIKVDCGTTNVAGITSWTEPPISPTDVKVAIETEKLRICSPNYNGVFEFQPIKAGIYYNEIEFDLDCTFMPQTPYIHVAPVFKGRLYGVDYDDARGLICGGDFSMAQSSDAWETYKAQNKNYQIAFNRQIENIEVHNKYGRLSDTLSAITGTIQGAAVGAQLGGGGLTNANPGGAGAGALIGSLVSAAAGAGDIGINEMMRKEALDYTIDNFGYSLGNIKALPDSLVKLPAQVYNNKYFPFVEFYTCTEEEKRALRNKIKYNGMTIMRIGNIEEFLREEETYIKGQLIRSESINCDEHELQAIAIELNKGLFMKG